MGLMRKVLSYPSARECIIRIGRMASLMECLLVRLSPWSSHLDRLTRCIQSETKQQVS